MYDPGTPNTPWFDGWTLLAGMATQTSRIRIGALVSNPIFRNPAVLAKQAIAIDHMSNGRLNLGIGSGLFMADHKASGVAFFPPKERVERFREFVEVVDKMLRNEVTTYHGQYYCVDESYASPGPIQRPRPPLTLAAHGTRMLKIAAAFADSWSSFGGFNLTSEEMFKLTQERVHKFDRFCSDVGRDPSKLDRSLLVFPPLDPWSSVEAFREIVDRYQEIGITEFILYWPIGEQQLLIFEQVARTIIPRVYG
jgi:alkanesulfonate monooxygenase SsuD/methylene tetrahydromethanopterin reductase-like flavin-dependent oxidoreductase (luciferase family)